MREILFRGKRTDNGEWVEGYLVEGDIPDYHAYIVKSFVADIRTDYEGILSVDLKEVLPETVGQYTGLTDKNGNRIFEGDVIITIDTGYDRFLVGEVRTTFGFDFRYILDTKDDAYVTALDIGDIGISADDKYLTSAEVIGNIHDNPELLEMV